MELVIIKMLNNIIIILLATGFVGACLLFVNMLKKSKICKAQLIAVILIILICIVFFVPAKQIPSSESVERIVINYDKNHIIEITDEKIIGTIMYNFKDCIVVKNPLITISRSRKADRDQMYLYITYIDKNRKGEILIDSRKNDNNNILGSYQVYTIFNSKNIYVNLKRILEKEKAKSPAN